MDLEKGVKTRRAFLGFMAGLPLALRSMASEPRVDRLTSTSFDNAWVFDEGTIDGAKAWAWFKAVDGVRAGPVFAFGGTPLSYTEGLQNPPSGTPT